MTVSRWLDQSASVNEECDALVIGGGIAGLSTAYWLQKEYPDWRVVVVEKNRIGSGASGRNAGFVTCGSAEHFLKLQTEFGAEEALNIWRFSEENHRLLRSEIIGDDLTAVEYSKTGSCTVAPDEERWKVYQETGRALRAAGLPMNEISSVDLEKHYGIRGFKGGLHYADDGAIHPVKLLGRLREKLRAKVVEGAEVFRIESGPTVKAHTDRGVFRAKQVFVTVNAYLPLVLPDFSKVITPGRGQILLTEPLPHFVQGPCYLTKHLCYFRQLPTGHLLVGGFRNLALKEEETYLDATTDVIQNALFDFVKQFFTHGAHAKVAYRWAGTMGFTPDGQMLIGNPKDKPNVHLMAGCSGHGMGLSFHAAKVLVGQLKGAPIPKRYHLARFGI